MLRIAAGAFLLVLCSGCKGSGGGADANGGGDVGELVAISCDRARRCCAEEGLSTTPLDQCEVETVEQSDFYKAIDRGTVVLVEPAFSECLEVARASANVCDLSATVNSACLSVTRGTVAAGGVCYDAVECASDGDPVACLSSTDISADAPGVCRAMVRGRVGDECAFSTNELYYGVTYSTPEPDPNLVFCDAADGLYCAFPGAACTVFAAEGAPCTDREGCAPGLYCETTCKPRKPAGTACTGSEECAQLTLCKDGTCAHVSFADTEICEGDFD